jgi:nicotinamidase-related amidase
VLTLTTALATAGLPQTARTTLPSAGDVESADPATLTLHMRRRVEVTPGSGLWHSITEPMTWLASETCIVVCDMWDRHWCQPAADRVAEMAPAMNHTLKAARERGVLIIHCPSETMDFYRDTPQRKLAMLAPVIAADPPLEPWCRLDPMREGDRLPVDDSDGGCDCDPPVESRRVWTRQHPAIEIAAEDAITDSAEAWYLMKQRGIRNVIVAGVHTNKCVLGRPFGIRQLVRQQMNVVLLRDLTDSLYDPASAPYVSHFTGTDRTVEHIEQYWCPSVLSSDLTGTIPFRFSSDTRPHIAFVISEPEYKTEISLTEFAHQELGRDFRVSMIYGSAADGSQFPGLEALSDADLLVLSVRRRTPEPAQLAVFRNYIDSGRPLLAIRTSSHAFSLRDGTIPEGRAAWPEFDRDVIGGHYTNHHGHGPKTLISLPENVPAGDPLLTGVDLTQLAGVGSLYKVSPLQTSARPLLNGTIAGQPAEPVAWLFDRGDTGVTFYTSLGHTGDFAQPAFRRLLLNACHHLIALP